MKLILTSIGFCTILGTIICTAQWPTTTSTDNSLYVCPGFYPDILTFPDGSSIVLGALSSYIYAQKLDPYGYAQWPAPVQVHHNDSSHIDEAVTSAFNIWGGFISDGDSGIILFWYDHRGAYDTGTEFANNALYIQRVDKLGVVRWMVGGVKAVGPETGNKEAGIVSDEQSGCIIGLRESGFGYPGAPNYQRIRLIRISPNGQVLWEKTIDSSASAGVLDFYSINTAKNKVILRRNIGYKVFTFDGNEIYNHSFHGDGPIIVDIDSSIFHNVYSGTRSDSMGQKYFQYELCKYATNFDSLWSCVYEIKDEAGSLGYGWVREPYIPDAFGGIFTVWWFKDNSDTIRTRAQRVTSMGAVWDPAKIYISNDHPIGNFFGPGQYGMLFAKGTAQLYDTSGNPIWSEPVRVLSDPYNAYNGCVGSDRNGGGIYCFWTTNGGIYAQHTGRHGQVGIITSIDEIEQGHHQYILYQNYPNPFNPSTTISYSIEHSEYVTVRIYDILGRCVKTLIDEVVTAGPHTILFDMKDYSSGVYYYRLESKSYNATKKMLMTK